MSESHADVKDEVLRLLVRDLEIGDVLVRKSDYARIIVTGTSQLLDREGTLIVQGASPEDEGGEDWAFKAFDVGCRFDRLADWEVDEWMQAAKATGYTARRQHG